MSEFNVGDKVLVTYDRSVNPDPGWMWTDNFQQRVGVVDIVDPDVIRVRFDEGGWWCNVKWLKHLEGPW